MPKQTPESRAYDACAANRNCFEKFLEARHPELYQGNGSQSGIAQESGHGTGTELDEYALRTPGYINEEGKRILKNIGRGADVISGFINPAKGAHDAYEAVKGLSVDDAYTAYQSVKDNPEEAALVAALFGVCKTKCRTADDLEKYKGVNTTATRTADLRKILKDLDEHTLNSPISDRQKRMIADKLGAVKQRSTGLNKQMREAFDSDWYRKNSKLRSEWERQTGRTWPEGATPHHIIPLKNGGTNEWWNIAPVKNSINTIPTIFPILSPIFR